MNKSVSKTLLTISFLFMILCYFEIVAVIQKHSPIDKNFEKYIKINKKKIFRKHKRDLRKGRISVKTLDIEMGIFVSINIIYI